MSFSAGQPDELRRPLADLLGVRAAGLTIRPEAGGWRSRAFRVSIRGTAGQSYEVLLKRVQEQRWYLPFYRGILQPLNLNSPTIFGYVEWAGQGYMVMEYIPHKQINRRDIRQLQRVLSWLVHKDVVIDSRREWIRQGQFVEFTPPVETVVQRCFRIMQQAFERDWGPPLTAGLRSILDEQESVLGLAKATVENSPQTLSHFDFHLSNVLLGIREKTRQTFVVDWSRPHMDSVCIDLAQFIGSVPVSLRHPLLELYRSRINFPGFGETFRGAQFLTAFYYLVWDLDMINGSLPGLIHSPRFLSRLQRVEGMLSLPRTRV